MNADNIRCGRCSHLRKGGGKWWHILGDNCSARNGTCWDPENHLSGLVLLLWDRRGIRWSTRNVRVQGSSCLLICLDNCTWCAANLGDC